MYFDLRLKRSFSDPLPGLRIELLGLVADSNHKIVSSLSVTKPYNSIPKPGHCKPLTSYYKGDHAAKYECIRLAHKYRDRRQDVALEMERK